MPDNETALLAAPTPVQSAVAAVAGGRKPVALVRQVVLCGSPGDVGPGQEKEGGGREGGKEKEDKEGEKGGKGKEESKRGGKGRRRRKEVREEDKEDN